MRRRGIRGLLLLVALASVAFWFVSQQIRRREAFLRRKYAHEASWHAYAEGLAQQDLQGSPSEYHKNYEQMISYHNSMKNKYDNATKQPLAPVQSDPAPPIDPQSGFPYMRHHSFDEE